MEETLQDKHDVRLAKFKKMGIAGKIEQKLGLTLDEYPHTDNNSEWTCKHITWNFHHNGRNKKIERSIGIAVNGKKQLVGVGMNDSGATSFEVHLGYNSEDDIFKIIEMRKKPFKKIAMYIFKNMKYSKLWIDGKKFPRT